MRESKVNEGEKRGGGRARNRDRERRSEGDKNPRDAAIRGGEKELVRKTR